MIFDFSQERLMTGFYLMISIVPMVIFAWLLFRKTMKENGFE